LFTETTKGQSKEGCAAQNIDERNVASVPILLWKSAISITRCLAGMAPGIADPVEASSLV
jgi:hypothetical protein